MSHLGNSGEEVLSYSLVKDGAENVKHTDPEQLQTVYYIDRCVAWVRKRALNKVIMFVGKRPPYLYFKYRKT